MALALGRVPEHLGDDTCIQRLGQDTQPFGEEHLFDTPVFFVAKRAHLLDERIGKASDEAGHQSSPNFASINSTSALTDCSAPSPCARIVT